MRILHFWEFAPRFPQVLVVATLTCATAAQGASTTPSSPAQTFRQYCFACHSKSAAGGINLDQLIASSSVGDSFQQWQKVAAVLEQRRMPPAKMPQPADGDRTAASAWIKSKLNAYALAHAGDPGRVTVRRLTSSEYQYTLRDLTGLDLKFDADFANDSVGGEGFTNFGDVQFMADANLERYLESAKKVADHAVIGAGPLQFFDDPGKSGFELSAIDRIQKIYRKYGFRSNSGEGGKPYGQEHYTKAFFVCWQYQHREALGQPSATVETLAAREGVSPRLVNHLWTVLHQPSPVYPTTQVITAFRSLPAPGSDAQGTVAKARERSADVMRAVVDWPRWLLAAGGVAEGGEGDERSLVLSDASLKPALKQNFKYLVRGRNKSTAKVYIRLMPANPDAASKPFVIWRNATVSVRGKDRAVNEAKNLYDLLDEETRKKIGFGTAPAGITVGPREFVTAADSITAFDLTLPAGAFGAQLQIEAEVAGSAGDAVLRATISDAPEIMKGVPMWGLLGDPASPGFAVWKRNVLEFARLLPQNSQGEPAPADKDPIPAPFDNTYNQPERDQFHAKLKYFRDDRFLVEHVLDDATRQKLEEAWADLLASFDYHDTFLNFVANKYKVDLHGKKIATLTAAEIEAMPAEPRQYVQSLRAEYDAIQKAQLSARPRHIEDCMEFAARAWRRPLTAAEKDRLRAFYVQSTEMGKLDHGKAIEALLARILVSPAFLYRLEQAPDQSGMRPLSGWELASRLSYFLWSSAPDEELRRAAATGKLQDEAEIDRQVKRMLGDPKARRFAEEFFGQWLGFYRFDQHRGVDTKRFPEFTEEVKAGMYDEAVSFFEYIVRNNRPADEVFGANYTFLNKALAKHYGITTDLKATSVMELVSNSDRFGRGGALRLGAVLTATSAPLRTSPVKRGDWVLRRVLGTPTPPPPADAGSIPADDKLFGGMSVKERLEVHKRNATCAGCHTRIDPLGFPFEKYDSVGRVRTAYSDGKPIDDTSVATDNTKIAGIDGLIAYLHSQDLQVRSTMSRKLLGYALGRTVLLSDQPLIDQMVNAGGQAPFSALIGEVVKSRQFRYRREQPAIQTEARPQSPAVTQASKQGGL